MGKKLDAFFRKSFNTSKFKSTVTNALARIAILKRQHQERWSQARSDVVQLLNLDHRESAILRVDHVIREQNLLDALVIIEGYCMLLMERIALIKSSIECPEELKEAVASVIYAASRYGQLPELQKICRIFMKKYGKELIDRANELRNNCGVNPKVAEKLSARRRSLRTRLKVLKQIAAEHSITLQLEEENSEVTREKIDARETTHLEGQETETQTKELSAKKMKDGSFYAYLKARNRYRDVKQAAQAAYKLASRAAAAAKVAVELSQTKLPDNDRDDSNHQEKHLAKHNEEASLKEVKQRQKEARLHEFDAFEASFRNFSIQMPNKSFRSESEEAGPSNTEAATQEAVSVFTSESDVDTNQQLVFKIPDQTKTMVMEVGSDGKEEETKTQQHKQPWLKQADWDIEKKLSSFTNEFLSFRNSDVGKDESNSSDHPTAHDYPSHYPKKGRLQIVQAEAEGQFKLGPKSL